LVANRACKISAFAALSSAIRISGGDRIALSSSDSEEAAGWWQAERAD
jgi:hypothetical protein